MQPSFILLTGLQSWYVVFIFMDEALKTSANPALNHVLENMDTPSDNGATIGATVGVPCLVESQRKIFVQPREECGKIF